MGNNNIIGGVKFDGVKVLKSEIKGSGNDKTYCVWTDAGYMEYKAQQKNENGFTDTAVHAVKYTDTVDQKALFINNFTNGTVFLDSSNYTGGIGVSGKDEGFTLNAKNGQKEILINVFNNAQVIKDDFDNVKYKKFK